MRTLAIVPTLVATSLVLAFEFSKAFAGSPSNCKLAYDAEHWDKAVVACRIAGELNNQEALYLLAQMHKYGNGVEKDVSRFTDLVLRAAELGYAKAQFEAGYIFKQGNNDRDKDQVVAKKWFTAAQKQFSELAAKGNSEAQLYLGYLYYDGVGVAKKDIHTAATWFVRAAKAGNEEAHENLLWLTEEGVGAATDWVMARARAGDAKSNDRLYELLDSNMLPNTPAVVNWLREKALAGDDKARLSLIRIYIAEVLFDQDIKRFDRDLGVDYSACVKKGARDCDELVWTFVDVNGDGLIGRAELARFVRIGLKTIGRPSKYDNIDEVMQIKTILFASGLVSGPVVARLIIENYDYDEDGRLSRKEIELDFPKGDPPIVALVNRIVFAEISKNMDDISSEVGRIVRRLLR